MSEDHKINGEIKSSIVILIDPEEGMIGKVAFTEAKRRAIDSDLDLVQVSLNENNIPICKLMDYGKMKYHEGKKKKNKTNAQIVKEVRFGANISDHDLKRKNSQILSFLIKHYKVRISMSLKNVHFSHSETVNQFIENIKLNFADFAQWQNIEDNNKIVSTVLTPISQKQ